MLYPFHVLIVAYCVNFVNIFAVFYVFCTFHLILSENRIFCPFNGLFLVIRFLYTIRLLYLDLLLLINFKGILIEFSLSECYHQYRITYITCFGTILKQTEI